MSFDSLNLKPALLQALAATGYTEPTPVQSRVIPVAIAGHDLMVSAPTGTGKTAAFVLPALQRLAEPSTRAGRGPRLLVLTPTRELALQVTAAVEDGIGERAVCGAGEGAGVPRRSGEPRRTPQIGNSAPAPQHRVMLLEASKQTLLVAYLFDGVTRAAQRKARRYDRPGRRLERIGLEEGRAFRGPWRARPGAGRPRQRRQPRTDEAVPGAQVVIEE